MNPTNVPYAEVVRQQNESVADATPDRPATGRSMTDRIALNDVERALSTADTSERHMSASVALNGFEDRVELLGLAGATTVLRHYASAHRARRLELRDLRAVKSDVFRERIADRRAVSR